jgi:AP-1 complex subunit gamma-1
MKLTASPHFPEKRIGYLGMLLLLSENAEVLMLSTNALKSDLTSENKFIAGLALCAIGNLATADMSRDLAPEVDKHLKSNLPYLRKKASLAMARCLAKCPDMVEDFVDRIVSLLKDRTHGVLVTVVQLMTQVLIIDYRTAEEEGEDPFDTPCRNAFLKVVPVLVRMLRNMLGSGYSTDYEVSGIVDPFLQVQILSLLRLLGANNERASEEMNDVLAQVATNTETAKNAGNAILYECVQTIMGIESEDGLRVLAVNILGRFLLNRDNNIRYVALNTLARCIVEQKQTGRDDEAMAAVAEGEANNAMSALQRHRTTVVECLKDPDISIRQRALELIYHLVNETNVETLTAELLNYLVLCPREHKSDICTRILKVVDRFSPDDRWRVDTLITTLTIAGREATLDVQSATIIYISRASSDIHAFATHKLLKAIRDDDGSQSGLLAVAVWCIGEYGEMLLQPHTYTPRSAAGGSGVDDLTNPVTDSDTAPITFMEMDPSTIVATLEEVTKRRACPEFVKQRALTAYAKLTDRFADKGDAAALQRLEALLKKHDKSRSLELQLRSCEFNALVNAAKGVKLEVAPPTDDIFGVSNGGGASSVSGNVQSAAKDALARMPVVDAKLLHKRLSTDEFSVGSEPRQPRAAAAPKAGGAGGDLLDLADVFGAPAPAQNGGAAAAPVTGGGDAGKSDLDLLADIFAAQPTQAAPAPAVATTNNAFDMFGAGPAPTPAPAPVNPMDLFGAAPAAAPAAPAASMDIFGAAATPAAPAVPLGGGGAAGDLFGAPAAPAAAPGGDIFGAAPVAATSVRVPGISHGGLSIEFECSKPDNWNKQKSTLLAHFKNDAGAIIYGMNLQVAVPKYVQMDMDPPSSTTIPQSGGNAKTVTQKVNVTNSMLGTKNLVLKLKIGFTLNGQKMEHMATCSGFPPGEY